MNYSEKYFRHIESRMLKLLILCIVIIPTNDISYLLYCYIDVQSCTGIRAKISIQIDELSLELYFFVYLCYFVCKRICVLYTIQNIRIFMNWTG